MRWTLILWDTREPSSAKMHDRLWTRAADVRAVFESVLRRLYRQRNIVVHAGTQQQRVDLRALGGAFSS